MVALSVPTSIISLISRIVLRRRSGNLLLKLLCQANASATSTVRRLSPRHTCQAWSAKDSESKNIAPAKDGQGGAGSDCPEYLWKGTRETLRSAGGPLSRALFRGFSIRVLVGIRSSVSL